MTEKSTLTLKFLGADYGGEEKLLSCVMWLYPYPYMIALVLTDRLPLVIITLVRTGLTSNLIKNFGN
jgi:hypothetical protein